MGLDVDSRVVSWTHVEGEMTFTVSEIVDGDTFKVSENWEFDGKAGDRVRPAGYDTPEEDEIGYDEATERLEALILDKEVELRNPIKISYGRLLCDGVNLAEYFPEYS